MFSGLLPPDHPLTGLESSQPQATAPCVLKSFLRQATFPRLSTPCQDEDWSIWRRWRFDWTSSLKTVSTSTSMFLAAQQRMPRLRSRSHCCQWCCLFTESRTAGARVTCSMVACCLLMAMLWWSPSITGWACSASSTPTLLLINIHRWRITVWWIKLLHSSGFSRILHISEGTRSRWQCLVTGLELLASTSWCSPQLRWQVNTEIFNFI